MASKRTGEALSAGVQRDGVDLPPQSITVPVNAKAEAVRVRGIIEESERAAAERERPEPVLGVLTGQVEAPVVGDPESREQRRDEMVERLVEGTQKQAEEPEPPVSVPEPEPEFVDLTVPPAFPQPPLPPEAPQPQGGARSRPRNPDPQAGWDTLLRPF